jgi:hypothetical protein
MKIKRLAALCFVPALLMLAGCEDNKDCDNPSMILPGETLEKRLAEFERRCPDQAKASAQLRAGTFKKSEPREW